jgi:hypothetical protein
MQKDFPRPTTIHGDASSVPPLPLPLPLPLCLSFRSEAEESAFAFAFGISAGLLALRKNHPFKGPLPQTKK